MLVKQQEFVSTLEKDLKLAKATHKRSLQVCNSTLGNHTSYRIYCFSQNMSFYNTKVDFADFPELQKLSANFILNVPEKKQLAACVITMSCKAYAHICNFFNPMCLRFGSL